MNREVNEQAKSIESKAGDLDFLSVIKDGSDSKDSTEHLVDLQREIAEQTERVNKHIASIAAAFNCLPKEYQDAMMMNAMEKANEPAYKEFLKHC